MAESIEISLTLSKSIFVLIILALAAGILIWSAARVLFVSHFLFIFHAIFWAVVRAGE